MINFLKKCPLTAAIIVTFVLLNIAGIVAIFKNEIDYSNISVRHPLIASVLEHISGLESSSADYDYDETPIDSVSSFAIGVAGSDTWPVVIDMPSENADALSEEQQEEASDDEGESEDADNAEEQLDEQGEHEQPDDEEKENVAAQKPISAREVESVDAPAVTANYGKVVYTDRYTGEVCNPVGNESNVTASSTVYNYSSVDDDFFADSLFIGDSETWGLCLYGVIEPASFCFKNGLTVWSFNDGGYKDKNQEDTTLDDVLGEKIYNNIYVMIGINEASYGTAVSYANKFREDVLYIRNAQPTANIIIMGVLPVTQAYSSGGERSNSEITTRNVYLSYLANGVDVFYLDVSEAVSDENGALNEIYSYDGVHLKAQYYSLWKDFIYTHAFVN